MSIPFVDMKRNIATLRIAIRFNSSICIRVFQRPKNYQTLILPALDDLGCEGADGEGAHGFP